MSEHENRARALLQSGRVQAAAVAGYPLPALAKKPISEAYALVLQMGALLVEQARALDVLQTKAGR
jgi:hypothetical protein